jgi:hypothetical protein
MNKDMRIQIPDHVVSQAVRAGFKPSQAASVMLAVEDPKHTYTLADGSVKVEGHGVIVIGKPDSTGKFFKISKIRLAK